MRRLSLLLGVCLLSGCATFGDGGSETGRKYVVFFTKGSASIDGPARVVVAQASAISKRHPELVTVVAGYAAANGSLDADAALSSARAQAVSAALQSDGVSAEHLREIARPPANESPAVSARRVEIGFVSP